MTSRSRGAGAFAVCALLAVIHTWPLAVHPGRYSRNDNGDAQLNEWIMAWVAHQLPRDPAHLFEGNIFYPAHDVLAYSEPLIVPALMGAPLAWLGASPVLVFNLILIAGFALTAFAGYLLIDSWTGDWAAGVLTGSMLAFNTHTLTRLAHVQGIHIYGLPLALLATDRLLQHARMRDGWRLAWWMTVLTYTSGYLAVFGTVMIAVSVAVRAGDWWGARAKVILSRFALAAGATVIAILPVSLPYQRVARTLGMVRNLQNAAEYSATLKGYLAAAGRIHYFTWSGGFFRNPVDSFFPGVIILIFAGVAIAMAMKGATSTKGASTEGASTEGAGANAAAFRSRVLMLVTIAVTGVVLSLGPSTPIYGWLFHVFPPMQGLRAAARFGNLFLLGVAALGGLGFAAWRRRRRAHEASAPRARRLAWIAAAVVVAANAESLRAPFPYYSFTGIPAVYRLLAHEPGRVIVAEVPFYPRQAVFENGGYVLASTAHWRPLMNGYSGYTPDTYVRYAETFWYFPEERAIQAMKDAGVTHVMVHPERFDADADKVVRAVSARTDFELVAIGQRGIRLYRLKP